MICNKMLMSFYNVVKNSRLMDETMFCHGFIQSMNHLVRFKVSIPDNRMQLVDHSVMRYYPLHLIHIHLHVSFEKASNLRDPSVITLVHRCNICAKCFRQIKTVNVQFQNLEHLIEQFLLMQIIELQRGVHFINDRMLVHKYGKRFHDVRN